MFLSDEDLQEITGYKRHAEQTRWLKAYGIQFALDRWRRPRVLRIEVERALSKGTETSDSEGPRLNHIRKKAS